jgi:hypothetical protein
MAISWDGREVSRFPAKSFLPLKISIKRKKVFARNPEGLTLTVGGRKLSLTKPKFMTYRHLACGLDLSGVKNRPAKQTAEGWWGFRERVGCAAI